MCGIAGFVSFRHAPAAREAALARMLAIQVHRGPDDAGSATSGPASLGMRRLAILDLANGRQPMVSPDGRHHLVFNGAIYNFRALRLDELPQLWNVLKGDMSMIGPRAEWDVLVSGYEREIPCYHFRHLVRPGITGWAQINYPYGAGIEDNLRKLEYDLFYIRHYSFQIDASIVLKTIHVMLFDKGSR